MAWPDIELTGIEESLRMEEGAVLGARCTGAFRFDMTALRDRSIFDERSTVVRCLSNRIRVGTISCWAIRSVSSRFPTHCLHFKPRLYDLVLSFMTTALPAVLRSLFNPLTSS